MSGGTGGHGYVFMEDYPPNYYDRAHGGTVAPDGSAQAGQSGSGGVADGTAFSDGGGGGSAGGGAGGAGGGTQTSDARTSMSDPETVTGGAGGMGGQNGAALSLPSTGTPSDVGPETGTDGAPGLPGVETNGGSVGSGGGGEGGYGLILTPPTTQPPFGFAAGADVIGALTGGEGGDGGQSSVSASGAGGDGGIGLDVLATGAVVNASAAIRAGNGGASLNGSGGGGIGGNGGIGVFLSDGDAFTTSSSVTGGNGGTGALNGTGGVGIVGSNFSVSLNSGSSVSGGYAGGGAPGAVQADAIDVTGGASSLLMAGGTLSGGIGIEGIGTTLDIEELGGSATLANTISGAGGLTLSTFESTPSIIHLTGSNSYAGGTTIGADTQVVVSDDDNLGAAGGALMLEAGSTLEAANTLYTSFRTVQIDGPATIQVDNAGTVLNLRGPITGSTDAGSTLGLTKTGAGTLYLTVGYEGFSSGIALDGGTLELATEGSGGSAAIAFGSGPATLDLNFGGFLYAHVTGFAAGDRLDFRGAVAYNATVSYANGVLTVSDGFNSTELAIDAPPPGEQFTESNDGIGYALVTLTPVPASADPSPAPTNPFPAPASPDAVAIDRAVTFSRGVFTLTGKASSAAGVASVEISALVDGVATDLGSATVNADGTFSFSDRVGPHTQGFITATETDGAGAQATSADPGFSLTGGLRGPGGTTARQTLYTADGTGEAAVDLFTPGGSQRDTIKAPGQTVTSAYADRFNDGGQPETTFVFDPGHGTDVVNLFRVDGSDHDTLSFSGSDYGNSVADVLRHTFQTKAGDAVIYDPAVGDAVRLTGITKAQLAANQGDIAFHG